MHFIKSNIESETIFYEDMWMILFQLWREYKLSVAELLNVYPEIIIEFVSKQVLLVSNLSAEKALSMVHKLWWTIKIGIALDWTITHEAMVRDWKFQYAISSFWGKTELKKYLMNQKKELKSEWVSSRFVNKDFQNASSAQILWEGLVDKWTDFSIVSSWWEKRIFKTIWVQDIDAYMKRDYSKSRDMQVWMLPPKLSQMMINFSWWTTIYDPFVWLWTILIESVYMGNKSVYGSDLADSMIQATTGNLSSLQWNKDFEFYLEKLNAKFIDEYKYLWKVDAIVSEWYLWEVMTMKNISLDRIEKQKSSLEKIYEWFFYSLKKAWYRWNIVICFPFWEINKKYIYAENLYKILSQYTNISEIIPFDSIPEQLVDFLSHSKSWSLLYKRHNQLVWREIFKLTIK